MQKLLALVSSIILGLLNPTAVILGLNGSKWITTATMAVNPLFSSKLRIAAPAVSQSSNQRLVEAESASGGTVIADGDASGLHAVTRASDGTYTWWVLPSGNAPHGSYTAFVRARTADGQPHTFTEHVLSDETSIAILATSVNSSAYRWRRLSEFNFSGSTLRLSDCSNPSLVVDKVIIEPVQVVNAKDVSGGTLNRQSFRPIPDLLD